MYVKKDEDGKICGVTLRAIPVDTKTKEQEAGWSKVNKSNQKAVDAFLKDNE